MAKVYIDAAARENPTLAASAGVIIDDAATYEFSRCCGAVDNHIAEWMALIDALKHCNNHNIQSAIVYTDSQLVVDAVNKNYVKRALYQSYLKEVQELTKNFTLFIVSHLPRSKNKRVDQLAKDKLFECMKGARA